MRRYRRTRALVEGDANLVREIVREAEAAAGEGGIAVLDEPNEELVMLQVRETAQGSRFYLGEALMTSCRVRLAGAVGYGLVLGGDRCRAYELAVADAAFSGPDGERWAARWDERLERELAAVEAREADQARRAALTKVDFSTMEVDL
ncbi:MAG TPA: phosphonate C-P lyase system protein PhnG [Candidatus Rubneribacter avistercoris]|nr:phosphonate C-P lyase system protein PhnG [Candidatus Rubneribacter avistercoris]